MQDPSTPNGARLTRRAFSRKAALAAAGFLAAGAASSQTLAPPVPQFDSAMEALITHIIARCTGLPETDRKELETQLKGVLDLAKTLRNLEVADGQEPDFVFRASKGGSDAR